MCQSDNIHSCCWCSLSPPLVAEEFEERAKQIDLEEQQRLEAAEPTEAPAGLLESAGCEHTTTTSDPVAAALLPLTMSLSLAGGSSKPELGPTECTCAGPALERESSRPSGGYITGRGNRSDNKMNHHTNHLEMC